MTTALYILLAICVVGQYALIKWLQHRRAKELATTHLAQARAHLVEAAADRQAAVAQKGQEVNMVNDLLGSK